MARDYGKNVMEAIAAGLLDAEEMREYEWEMKRNALARFTSEELARELKERANRRVVEFNARTPKRVR